MTHLSIGERGQRCLRNQPTGEHHWQPGPAVFSKVEPTRASTWT